MGKRLLIVILEIVKLGFHCICISILLYNYFNEKLYGYSKLHIYLPVFSILILGQTNLISGSTDPTDPVFAESKKNKKRPKKFCMHEKKLTIKLPD